MSWNTHDPNLLTRVFFEVEVNGKSPASVWRVNPNQFIAFYKGGLGLCVRDYL